MTRSVIVIIIVVFFYCKNTFGLEKNAEACGDETWVLYKDEKCLKLIDTAMNYDLAVDQCSMEIGSKPVDPLLTIKSEEEQKAITKLLFQDLQIFDNIWLGARRHVENGTARFLWGDGSTVDFSNWAPHHPGLDEGLECTQLTSRLSLYKGQSDSEGDSYVTDPIPIPELRSRMETDVDGYWKDTVCGRKNLAVCQKAQNWTSNQIQSFLVEIRRSHATLIKNPVPIGFIYTEFPGNPGPTLIWPQIKWTEVTANFAGYFFRAEGGGSAGFGFPQGDSTRQISEVKFMDSIGDKSPNTISLPSSGWSGLVRTGDNYGYAGAHWNEGIQFYTSPSEIRPKNMAVKIWKRTG